MIHSQAKNANIVIDIGSYHTFAGQSGYQHPKFASHSYVVNDTTQKTNKYCAGNQVLSNDFSKQIISIFEKNGPDGKIQKFHYNMDSFEKFTQAILFDNLQLQGCSVSVLFAQDIAVDLEPSQALKQKQKMIDYFIESMQLSSVAFFKKPVLASFALGRSTAVVLDSGHSFTSCTIVQDGYCVYNKTLKFGGSVIHNLVRTQIQKKMPNNQPWLIEVEKSRDNIKKNDIHFYRLIQIQKIIKQFPYTPIGATMVSQQSQVTYVLPDNHKIKISREQIVDPFIDYKNFWNKYLKNHSQKLPSFIDASFYKSQPGYRGLQQFIFDTIDEYLVTLDQKNRTCTSPAQSNEGQANKKRLNQVSYQDLINNIILTGGNLTFSDLAWSIQQGVRKRGGSVVQCPLKFNEDQEGKPCSNRNSLSWIGGSIVTGLQVFNNFWIKPQQWKHEGINLVTSKNLTHQSKAGNQPNDQNSRKTRKAELISKKFP